MMDRFPWSSKYLLLYVSLSVNGELSFSTFLAEFEHDWSQR